MASFQYMMKSDDVKIANITPFGLRLQPDLKRRVEAAARANGNSLNAEIAMRLEASFQADDNRQAVGDQVTALREEVAELRDDVKGLRTIVNMIIEVENRS